MSIVLDKDDLLLHKYAHLINYDMPGSIYIDYDLFPSQDAGMIGSIITVPYRKRASMMNDKKVPPEADYDYVTRTECKVLRWDTTEPFTFIAMNGQGKIFIGNIHDDLETISYKYTDQNKRFLNLNVKSFYNSMGRDQYMGKIVRCDDGDPCYGIILEYVDDTHIRFITASECQSKLIDYDPSEPHPEYTDESTMYYIINGILERYIIYGSDQ